MLRCIRIPASSIFKNTFIQKFEQLGKKTLSNASNSNDIEAWYKLTNPESNWNKVPLRKIKDVTDLKKAIKKETSPKLEAFTASDLTLKVVKKFDDVNQAVELDAFQSLASVLEGLKVEVPSDADSLKRTFAENVRLFVNAPVGE